MLKCHIHVPCYLKTTLYINHINVLCNDANNTMDSPQTPNPILCRCVDVYTSVIGTSKGCPSDAATPPGEVSHFRIMRIVQGAEIASYQWLMRFSHVYGIPYKH